MTVVMDSWLVRDGQVAGLDLHLERFAASCRALLGTAPPEAFLREVRGACARARGEWFPKVEAVNLDWRLTMRPVPPRRTTTVLWVPERPDEREHPEHKGPDMAGLLDLRSQARERCADDTVLHRDGAVVEAATATLLFARGETLLLPPGPRLPGVTERLWVRNWAGPVCTETVVLEEAPGVRCWALSSLHGVTEVVGWVGERGFLAHRSGSGRRCRKICDN